MEKKWQKEIETFKSYVTVYKEIVQSEYEFGAKDFELKWQTTLCFSLSFIEVTIDVTMNSISCFSSVSLRSPRWVVARWPMSSLVNRLPSDLCSSVVVRNDFHVLFFFFFRRPNFYLTLGRLENFYASLCITCRMYRPSAQCLRSHPWV